MEEVEYQENKINNLMITKNIEVTNVTLVKTSQKNNLAKEIKGIQKDVEEDIQRWLNSKQVKVGKTKTKMIICFVDKMPILYKEHPKDLYTPTLHILHRFPNALPRVKLLDNGAASAFFRSVGIWEPGIFKDDTFPYDLKAGDYVEVCLKDIDVPMGVAKMNINGADLHKTTEPVIAPLHSFSDAIWRLTH